MLQPARADQFDLWRHTSHRYRVLLIASLSALAWLLFVGSASSSDEGGYLLAAAHWTSGTSLYGDYWVDRPPGLIAVFALANALGGLIALRLIGAIAVVTTVLLAGVLGALVARPANAWLPAAAAGAVLSTPLFEAGRVNGEVLAAPFVLGGVVTSLLALRRGACWWAWSAATGVLAVLAMSVKQNFIDVFLVFAALTVVSRLPRGRALGAQAVMVGSALAVAAAILAGADTRGTTPAGLWGAVVRFRLQAGELSTAGGLGDEKARIALLIAVAIGSLVPVLLGAAGVVLRRPASPLRPAAPDLRWPALALIGWELVGVVAGGNFAPHYLLGLTAGITVLVAAAAQRWAGGHGIGRRFVVRALLATCCMSFVVVVGAAAAESLWSQDRAAEYLRLHAHPTDTAVTAFGSPSVIEQAGLTSPYPYLWSLEAKVNDPQLIDFAGLLANPDRRPTWVIVSGRSLEAPGLSVDAAQQVLDRYYVRRTTVPGWTVLGVSLSHWSIYEHR